MDTRLTLPYYTCPCGVLLPVVLWLSCVRRDIARSEALWNPPPLLITYLLSNGLRYLAPSSHPLSFFLVILCTSLLAFLNSYWSASFSWPIELNLASLALISVSAYSTIYTLHQTMPIFDSLGPFRVSSRHSWPAPFKLPPVAPLLLLCFPSPLPLWWFGRSLSLLADLRLVVFWFFLRVITTSMWSVLTSASFLTLTSRFEVLSFWLPRMWSIWSK